MRSMCGDSFVSTVLRSDELCPVVHGIGCDSKSRIRSRKIEVGSGHDFAGKMSEVWVGSCTKFGFGWYVFYQLFLGT